MNTRPARRRRRWTALAALATSSALGLARPAAAALTADELVLIVNHNDPVGIGLAKYYAEQRHVPAGRILELDLPVADDMPTRQYQEQVVPAVRAFLDANDLNGTVKCLVPVYGVPLRLSPRTDTPEESRELAGVRQELVSLATRLGPDVDKIEAVAKRLDGEYKPPTTDGDLDHLGQRFVAAIEAVNVQGQTIQDADRGARLSAEVHALVDPWFGGRAGELQARAAAMKANPVRNQKQIDDLQAELTAYQKLVAEAGGLEAKQYDPDARQRLREIAKVSFPLLQYAHLLHDQADFLAPSNSPAAFDNALTLVRWNVYPRHGWVENPMYYRFRGTTAAARAPLSIMTCRLDAPSPEVLRRMIDTSIKVERSGLSGKVVIDGLGSQPGQELPGKPGYAPYDQTLAGLDRLLTARSKLDVLFDQKPELLPAHAASDVAIYCGWYNVNEYVPCCAFAPGAVGFHVASYTLKSLRTPGQLNWSAGLLNEGCVATIGPVYEPFLAPFPKADEFFPLLLTGKLSLAECYWQTEPFGGWMMTLVGDPLYTPYKLNPPLTKDDLPFRLRAAFNPLVPAPVSPPTTKP